MKIRDNILVKVNDKDIVNGTVKIPSNVKVIGSWTFKTCENLENVIIPNSVTKIDNGAFYGCDKLKRVILPENVREIRGMAFSKCKSLESINLPNSIKTIEKEMFSNCENLTNIIIPNNVIEIEENAFENCTGLKSIEIPSNVKKIGNSAFYGCENLTSVNISNGVTEIGEWAFSGCDKLQSIEIPNSVIKIGHDAFRLCENLETIIIPSSVTLIEGCAFCNCKSLKSIEIPNGVIKIDEVTFCGCENLESITIPSSITEIEFKAFCDCKGLKIIEIPNSVIKIGELAFSGCESLESITIPSSVTVIEKSAFSNCTNLHNVIVCNKNTKISEGAFAGCPNINIIYCQLELVQENVPNTLGEFNSIMAELQKHIHNLQTLEISPLNTESSMTIEKFGDELKDYSMLISNGHYGAARLDKDTFKRNKSLRKILNQIDNRVTLFEKIGNSFLKEQDNDIVLNSDAMDKLKNFSSCELDTYRKQLQILECTKEMIKLYIQKLDECMQELNIIIQSEENNEFDKTNNNTLNSCIQRQFNRMQLNRTSILTVYNQISNSVVLNMSYITSLKEVTEVLLPLIVSDVANKKLVIRKQESVNAMKQIADILRNAKPKEIEVEVEPERTNAK